MTQSELMCINLTLLTYLIARGAGINNVVVDLPRTESVNKVDYWKTSGYGGILEA